MSEINLERALKIPGYMSFTEMSWLGKMAQSHKRIVEIGSLMGRSTRALADNTEGYVLAVDDFKGPRDTTLCWKERQSIPAKFAENLEDHIASGKVITWKANHATLDIDECPAPDKMYDMVFLDGDHKYDSMMRDLKFWQDKIEPGGLFCGHDFDLAWPGIVQSCSEVFGDKICIVPGTTIWVYVIPVVPQFVPSNEEAMAVAI